MNDAIIKRIPALTFLLVLVFFGSTWMKLFDIWTVWDGSMSHGLPLFLLFLYFIFKLEPSYSLAPISQKTLIYIGLFLSLITWYIATTIKFKVVEQIALIPILFFSLAATVSLAWAWRQRVMIGLLIYIIPIWEHLIPGLVSLASYAVGILVSVSHIPVLIDGNSFHIPSGTIVVADGCSGLRYLVISLALAHLISFLNGYKEKALFISYIIAVAIGLIANWMRIFILIIIGHESEMRSSLMADHEMFGWILFGVFIFPAIYFAPVKKPHNELKCLTMDGAVYPKLFALLTFFSLFICLSVLTNGRVSNKLQAYHIDSTVWMVSDRGLLHNPEIPKSLQRDIYVHQGPQMAIYLAVDQYAVREKGQQIVGYFGRSFDEEQWVSVKSERRKDINVVIYRNKYSQRIVAQSQIFDVAGFKTQRLLLAKLYQLPAILKGMPTMNLLTIQTECSSNDCSEMLESFSQLVSNI